MALALIMTLAACGEPAARSIAADPAEGRAVISRLGCGACHVIPGVRGAAGIVGPSLAGFAERALIAGQLPNEPATLIAFLRDAPAYVPGGAMPAMPLTEPEARDAAAYLYTLE
jgi:cytochrome c2